MNIKVDEYISKAEKWQQEQEKLRMIVLECGLTEEFKWGQPCYSFQGTNIVIISGFKEYCLLGLFNGALLSDEKCLLVKPGENTQAGRQIRFTSLKEIVKLETTIKAYIFEAIELEKAGLKVQLKKTSDYPIPEEFQNKLISDPDLKDAFEALTPGRQKAYLLFFAAAKQSQTRVTRIESSMKRIFSGKGPEDCICGHSHRMPRCDGTHKTLG
ncbi:MAG: YdeI/OmpD-associated family protein [Candidatus Kapabacteria bacterium]|nr:YdeI/OmpD-associated family protein [Candidatus Kapabacteria bacterium]